MARPSAATTSAKGSPPTRQIGEAARRDQQGDAPGPAVDVGQPAERAEAGVHDVEDGAVESHGRDFTFFQHLPTLVERDGLWRMPEGGGRIPLMYSLRAAKDR